MTARSNRKLDWIDRLPEVGGPVREFIALEQSMLDDIVRHEARIVEIKVALDMLRKQAEAKVRQDWSRAEIARAKRGEW